MQITNLALTSNVATATVLVREGNIPAIGSLISITGTAAASGAFNVTNIALTGVSINSLTGIGTVTFALTHADVVSIADSGQGYVPVPEVGESLTNQTCLQFGLPEVSGENTNARSITWTTAFTGSPSTVTVDLYGAMDDVDAQYGKLDTSTSNSGETRIIANVNFRFLRAKISNVSGGSSPTGIVKFLI
jgi:hypothetical protein